MKLYDELNKLDRYPFHMPGHKRNPKFDIAGAEIDITEIDGFDNLHEPNGMILDIENRLTKLYKSKKSFLMVNGSTGGILSAIYAVCNDGDKVIVARNCHKSVYNGCYLKGLQIVFVEPDYDSEYGMYTGISQKAIDDAIKSNPDAKAVIITSPTYEGISSDIKCDLPLIIDAAHGAHLFDSYPNADIVISSLHKTMPALTQTAVASIYNSKYIDKFKRYIDIFETSSPSYLLMASVEKGLDFIDKYGYSIPSINLNLEKLKIRSDTDASKLVISTANTNISGVELAQILRDKYKIEVEMASINYIILILTNGDEKADIDYLVNALTEIDKTLESKAFEPIIKPSCPSDIVTISYSKGCECEIDDSIGKTSNEFVFAYPPDIPILCPNEIITQEIIDYIKKATSLSINLISDSGLLPNKILTKCD